MEILPKGSEAQDPIGLKFPEGILTPDVSGSSSLTSGTLAMFLDVLKTYGDVFSRFVKFCVALQIPAAHQVDDVILCYKMLQIECFLSNL